MKTVLYRVPPSFRDAMKRLSTLGYSDKKWLDYVAQNLDNVHDTLFWTNVGFEKNVRKKR